MERDNLTSRQSNGRLVRKTLSYSRRKDYLRHHIDFEAAVGKGVAATLSECIC